MLSVHTHVGLHLSMTARLTDEVLAVPYSKGEKTQPTLAHSDIINI